MQCPWTKSIDRARAIAWSCAVCVVFTLSGCAPANAGTPHFQIINGQLDLRDWNFTGNGIVDLSGEWTFYPEQFLEPGTESAESIPLAVPADWHASAGIPAFSYGTYRLRVQLPDPNALKDILVLELHNTQLAGRMYVNEQLVASAGVVGTAVGESHPAFLPPVVFLSKQMMRQQSELELTVHISNYTFRSGGLLHAPRIGVAHKVGAALNRQGAMALFLFGSLGMMALYHVSLFLGRRSDLSALYFALICVALAIRSVVVGDQLMFPGTLWFTNDLRLRVEYASFYLGVAALSAYVHELYPLEYARILHRVAVITSLVFTATLVLPVYLFDRVLPIYQSLAIGLSLVILIAITRANLRARPGAGIFAAGITILVGTAVLEIVLALLHGRASVYVPFGMLGFVLTHSTLLARRFSRGFLAAEELTTRLEEKVSERTRQLAMEKAAADKARRESEQLAVISRQLHEQPDLAHTVTTIGNSVGELYPVDGLILLLVDRERNELYSAHAMSTSSASEAPRLAHEVRIGLDSDSALVGVFERKRPWYVRQIRHSLLQSEGDRQLLEGLGVNAFYAVPLVLQGKSVGLMLMTVMRSRLELTLEMRQRINRYCGQVVGALQGAKLLERVNMAQQNAEQAREDAEALAMLSRQATESSDLDAILKTLAGIAASRFQTDTLGLYLVDHARQSLEIRAVHLPGGSTDVAPYPDIVKSIPLVPESGTLYRTSVKKQVFVISRISREWLDKSPVDAAIQGIWNSQWFFHLPLLLEGEIVGLITGAGDQRIKLSAHERAFLEQVGTQIAGAVQSAALLEQVRKEQQRTEQARAESDRLLENILPERAAAELKDKGSVEPLSYASVSVLFTDFVGFTRASEQMSPEDLIKELDGNFSQFDAVCRHNRLEKLKTIGDAYMCAGGLPEPNHTHAIDTCLAALEFRSFMNQMADVKQQLGIEPWRIRIGIHSGPVTAGVIGENKFAYDIWGDTVNTASRMESSGEANRINVSGATYRLVQDFFVCEHRGKIDAKGKGALDMYFVERIKPELAADPEGLRPNQLFQNKLAELDTR